MTAFDPCGTAHEVTGPPEAPAVILVHGLGLTRAVWQWMVPELVGRFRVVTYDLAGHGESARPVGRPALGGMARQLSALLDHIGIARAAVVGFSLGGMVARRFAQDHPDRTSALAILNSPHRRTAAEQAAVLARVALAEAAGPAATVEAALSRWYTDAVRAARPDLVELTRSWVLGNDAGLYPGLYRVLADGVEEVVAPSPPIACPALVLTAEADQGNGPHMAAAIAGEIAGSRLVILPGLRHMALVEDPAAVNRPVAAFLTEVLS